MSNKIILGTVQFGLTYGINNISGKPSEAQVLEMLHYASRQGVDMLDTADAYGNANELIGKFNLSYPGYFSINTKFKRGKLSIREQLFSSLEILQLKKVNTCFFHSFEDFATYPDLLEELTLLKGEGKVQKTGLSVYDNEEFRVAIDTKEIDVIQFPFNLLDNYSQRGYLMKEAKNKGKELQVRSVFLQGLFFKSNNGLPSKLSMLKPYLKKIQDLAKLYNLSIEHLALQYAIQQAEIDHVIIGVDNIEQLSRNLTFAREMISTEFIREVNNVDVKETELLYPQNWN